MKVFEIKLLHYLHSYSWWNFIHKLLKHCIIEFIIHINENFYDAT